MSENNRTKASLFVTCIIDQFYPQVGVSTVKVLRKLGVEVDFPPEQTCCGQPLYNAGFADQSRKLAKRVLETFRESRYVVVPSGSCAAMMRVFYQDLFHGDPDLERQALELSTKVYEFSEFLVEELGVEEVGAEYSGVAAYHASCHLLRELGVKDAPAALLQKVRDLELRELPEVETCCGFGGAFSVKFPHISEAMLADKVENLMSTRADTLVSCDMGCLMHIEGALKRQGRNVKVRHLAQVLAQTSAQTSDRR